MTISSLSSNSVQITRSESISSSNFVSAQPVAESSQAAPVRAEQMPTPEHLNQAVEQINEAFAQKEQHLHAQIERDEATGISVVKVLDKKTDEVISQFPSKEILAIASSIRQYQEDKGYLLDVNA